MPENLKFLTASDANVEDVKEFLGLLEAFNTMAFEREYLAFRIHSRG